MLSQWPFALLLAISPPQLGLEPIGIRSTKKRHLLEQISSGIPLSHPCFPHDFWANSFKFQLSNREAPSFHGPLGWSELRSFVWLVTNRLIWLIQGRLFSKYWQSITLMDNTAFVLSNPHGWTTRNKNVYPPRTDAQELLKYLVRDTISGRWYLAIAGLLASDSLRFACSLGRSDRRGNRFGPPGWKKSREWIGERSYAKVRYGLGEWRSRTDHFAKVVLKMGDYCSSRVVHLFYLIRIQLMTIIH